MPGTFTTDLTPIKAAELVADYSLIGTLKTGLALNDDYKLQSTNAITGGMSSGSGTGTAHVLAITPSANLDLTSGGPHFFMWNKNFAWPSHERRRDGGYRMVISSDAPPTAVVAALDVRAENAINSDISVNAATPAFTRAAGSFITDGFLPGQTVTSWGFVNSGNNTTKVISTVAALTLTVTDATGLVTETGVDKPRLSSFGVTVSGTGYAVNDELTVSGGTGTAARLNVDSVSTLDTGAGGITINVVAAAGTFTRTTGNFLTDGFYAGRTIVTSGFTNPGNNATKIISTVTTTVITVTSITGLVDENGDGNERVLSTNGITGASVKAAFRGAYTTFPTNPVAHTGGTGTGATFTLRPIQTVTNSASWFVGGQDTDTVVGWQNYVVDINGTPDLLVGTAAMNSVDRMGFAESMVAVSKVASFVFDVSRYGTGSTINAGTGRAPVTMADYLAYDIDNAQALGVVTSQAGIYFLNGKLNFGTTGQSAETVFWDRNQTLVWNDSPVASGFYEMKVVGASGQETTFQLGAYIPASGLSSAGISIKGSGNTAGTTRLDGTGGMAHSSWKLTASAANQVTKLYNCNFSEMLSAALAYNTVSIDLSTVTNGTTTLTTGGSFDTSGIVVGMKITGTGIPSNTYVSSIQSATSLTMSNSATDSSTTTRTFAHSNEVRGCTFANFGTVTTNGCLMDNCIFQDLKTGAPISATNAIVVVSSTEGNRITNSKFINCNRAIKITTTGTYDFNNLTFSGNSYDIENSTNATNADSYSEANQDATQALGNGTIVGVAQSFTNASSGVLSNARFYLSKTSFPSGTATAKIYAINNGIGGGDDIPTGSALATSETVNVANLTGALTLTQFPFTDNYTMAASTDYVIALEYSGGDGSNYVNVGTDTSAPSHTGNFATKTGSTWSAVSGTDGIFYVSRGGVVTVNSLNGADPSTFIATGSPPGTVIINNAVNLTIHVVDKDNNPINTAQVAIYDASDDTQLMNEDTGTPNPDGEATQSYNYAGDVDIYYRVRKSSTGDTKYIPVSGTGTIDNGGFGVTVTMFEDVNA